MPRVLQQQPGSRRLFQSGTYEFGGAEPLLRPDSIGVLRWSGRCDWTWFAFFGRYRQEVERPVDAWVADGRSFEAESYFHR